MKAITLPHLPSVNNCMAFSIIYNAETEMSSNPVMQSIESIVIVSICLFSTDIITYRRSNDDLIHRTIEDEIKMY